LLRDAGIKLYAISYDDTEAHAAFAAARGIEFPLLSDPESRVIREYGVLNTLVRPEDVPFYGIPFPGIFLVDEDGVISDKLFNPHLANRETPEAIVDRALGRIEPGDRDLATTRTEDDGIKVTAFLRGGGGVLRIGPRRRLIVRFSLPPGLHIYGEPVPEGMVATHVEIEGPDGLRSEPVARPPTRPLELPAVDATLHVWEGTVDFVVPVFANSQLASRFESGEPELVDIRIQVRYQACDDVQCFIPRTRTLELQVPLEPSTIPDFDEMRGAAALVIDMDTKAHFQRLVARQAARAGETNSTS
jgi:hypothetical protein